eukprot:3420398-Pyramimonas_sp.AAC.1
MVMALAPRRSQMAAKTATMVQDCVQTPPSQPRSRRAQDGPKMSPGQPKMHPTLSKMASRWQNTAHEAPKRTSSKA